MAVKLALDTNRYTDLCRGDSSVVKAVELAGEVCLPFIVMGELRAGFAVGSPALGSPGPRNEAVLRRFLMKPGVGVLYANEQTAHHYAAVYRQLRKQDTPIPTNDMWIAALVLQHSLVLCARDAPFDALPQLPRVGNRKKSPEPSGHSRTEPFFSTVRDLPYTSLYGDIASCQTES